MASELIKHTTDATFEADVLKSTTPVVVDFWAEWCGPCKMIGPVVEEIANEYDGKLKVGKLDVDKNPEVSMKFGIRSIPTLMIFKDGENLKKELQFLIDNDIKDKGEYQLTSALENMRKKGITFKTSSIDEWLDCGNKEAVVHSNQRVLEYSKGKSLVATSVTLENAVIIPPCFIGANCIIRQSVVGPYVSIGANSTIEQSVISNSVIQNESIISDANLENSMVGNFVEYKGRKSEISIGDYSKYAS